MAVTGLYPDRLTWRLASLVTLLAENATIVISGARIARELEVSRTTVWRWVTRLRELGVKVKGQPATGYFLESVADILTPELLRKRLKGSLFREKRFYHFFKTDSTNRVAMALAFAGEERRRDSSGGRANRGARAGWAEMAFENAQTGIHMTLLLRPRLSPAQAPLLTILAGISLHAAILAQTTGAEYAN